MLLVRGIVGLVFGVVAFAWPAVIRAKSRWPHVVQGCFGVAAGVLVFAFPGAGAVGIAWVLGAYATAAGSILIALGIKSHSMVVA